MPPMESQCKYASSVIPLHPLDQEQLKLLGELPETPLFVPADTRQELGSPPSSVHTLQTSAQERTDWQYRSYTLKSRMPSYLRSLELYNAVDGTVAGRLSSRLQECRRHAFFFQNRETSLLRVMSSRCSLRWCPICRDVMRFIITKNVDEWLLDADHPKMVTFTTQHTDDPLPLQNKWLYHCFRLVRQRSYFKNLITGGIWFFQLKLNARTDLWHPHIHCLVAGEFLPHKRLKGLWHDITADSYIVDIRAVKDLENVSMEVARYATAPADLTKMSIDHALEVYYAMKGQRICGAWGSARGTTLKPKAQDDMAEWDKVADFYWINVNKEYNPAVLDFWKCYKKGKPYTGSQLQPLTDVFREELEILRSQKDLPKTDNQWHARIAQDRKDYARHKAAMTKT